MEIQELYSLVRASCGITTDSRRIEKGQIFFALKGPLHDGNRYAAAALAAGASAAVIDDNSLAGNGMILVPDVMEVLTALAKFHRHRFSVPVIAVTGTNGKTTTKELIAAVLSRKKKVHYTTGNLNNQIGVPLTLLAAPDDTGYMVIEMGANHKGEIAALCETAMPTHGIITNIGRAHLEGFGSEDGVREAKSELYHWLRKSGGIAIYNEQNEVLKELIYHITHKAIPYSDPYGSDLIVTETDSENLFLNVSALFGGRHYKFSTNLFGSYNLDNVRAAMAVGVFFEVDIDEIIDAVSNYRPSNNRSQLLDTGRNTVVCDSYNANPSSMEKALRSFAASAAGKKMVILGDMLELGSESEAAHSAVVAQLKELTFERVILAGPLFAGVSPGNGIESLPSADAVCELLRKEKPEGWSILVKGSRGMMLEKIYSLL